MIFLWFSYGTDPATGTAPLDDFVDRYVRDDILAAMIRLLKTGIAGEFDRVESWEGGLFAARARSDGRTRIFRPDPGAAGRPAVAKSFAERLFRLDSGKPYTLCEMAVTDSSHHMDTGDLIRRYEEYCERVGSESGESGIKEGTKKIRYDSSRRIRGFPQG